MAVPEGYFVTTTSRRPIKVHTMKGVQHHWGYEGMVRTPTSGRDFLRCGHPHKKVRGAKECGERWARYLAKEVKADAG